MDWAFRLHLFSVVKPGGECVLHCFGHRLLFLFEAPWESSYQQQQSFSQARQSTQVHSFGCKNSNTFYTWLNWYVKGTLGRLFCQFYYWRNFLRWVKLVVSSKNAFGQDCFMHEFVPCKVWNIAPYFKINFWGIISIDMIKFCRHDFMHMITNLCTRWFKLVQFLIIKVIFSIYASMFTWIRCSSYTSCGICDNFCSSRSPAKFDRHVEDVTSDMPWTTMCTDIVAILYICLIMK